MVVVRMWGRKMAESDVWTIRVDTPVLAIQS